MFKTESGICVKFNCYPVEVLRYCVIDVAAKFTTCASKLAVKFISTRL